MRRAARTDTNHSTVVLELRQIGAVVLDIHALPGALDALVAFRGTLTLLEIKDGLKRPSERRPTPDEKQTMRAVLGAGCPAWIVYNPTEAMVMIGAKDDPAARAEIIERTHQEVSR